MLLNNVREFPVVDPAELIDALIKISTMIGIDKMAIISEIFSARIEENAHLAKLGIVNWKATRLQVASNNQLTMYYDMTSNGIIINVRLIFNTDTKNHTISFKHREEKPSHSDTWRR